MTSRWLDLLEGHLEKGILGLSGAFLLVMLWLYLVRSPNTQPYGGDELGPRELVEAIADDTRRLQAVVQQKTAEPPHVDPFSEQLKRDHDQPIFASASDEGLAITPTLRLAADFGQPIAVPGLEETEEADSVELATPLKPSPPKLRTGRALALREQLQIEGLEEPEATPPPEETLEATEVAWVTVAAYFDKKAQYNDMIQAGYAPYRAKAYIVGTDVQRQEVLSTGEYSDWQAVKSTVAMPKFELSEPQFDDETGELMNKDEIRMAFAAVKYAQPTLMQPPFYPIERGDFWEVPPLEGLEQLGEEEEGMEEEKEEKSARPIQPRVFRPTPGVIGSGRTAGPSGPSPGGYRGPTRDEEKQKRQARRQVREDLEEAKKHMGRGEYDQARGLALRIAENDNANAKQKDQAEKIVKAAERWLERQRAHGSGRMGRAAVEFIEHPERGAPAVWFHDDTVEAGKTYRYRMRVNLWNRYVGQMRPLKDPERAKQTVIVGDWSVPSEPITVTPSTYYFFTGSRPPATASVDVRKWYQGRWLRERFDVTVGDVIGGPVRRVKTGEYDEEGEEERADLDFTTGAVVLDLRFDVPVMARWPGKDGVFTYHEKTSTVMVYLDPADGQVKERSIIHDRNDPKYKELKEEVW